MLHHEKVLNLEQYQALSAGVADIVTPVGSAEFTARLGTDVVAGAMARWQLPSGATLHRSNQPSATVDLITGPVENGRYGHTLAVTTVWAAVWQIRAETSIAGLELTAAVTGLPAEAEPSPDSGEHLEAVTVEHPITTLSMGGPDLDLLCSQATVGSHLPRRWQEYLPSVWYENSTPYHVDISVPGQLTWRLPGLEPGETVGLCVAVAWRPTSSDTDNVDTWLAVDCRIDYALGQLVRPVDDRGAGFDPEGFGEGAEGSVSG